MSLAEVVDLLACPYCGRSTDLARGTLRCRSGHSFDIAKQGYVNLLGRRPPQANADTGEMIAARIRFLGGGHYAPLADLLASFAEPVEDRAVLEAGAGPGYYLGHLLDRIPDARGLATDLSAAAARRSARAHDRIGAVVADTWAGLPIRDAALDLIMVVFAPRNPAEFTRLLRPGGRLQVVSAAPDHLVEVREPLGLIGIQPGKQQRLLESLTSSFEPVHTERLSWSMRLRADDLADLVAMGPNAHHRSDQLSDRIAELGPPVTVTATVDLSVFRRSSSLGPDGGD